MDKAFFKKNENFAFKKNLFCIRKSYGLNLKI